ncbi:hypothetical protein HUT06_24150 [Actinomadura sp. NAK00032]|nr:hypothetical protein [Actinomadura sp. NAK00032]QKW36736.1 hypothetical protein HUT06_24150 [Actinomadura sp. NAK00032]
MLARIAIARRTYAEVGGHAGGGLAEPWTPGRAPVPLPRARKRTRERP